MPGPVFWERPMNLPNLYHGTSPEKAERILRDGFHPVRHRQYKTRSKAGFVYLSTAYAPFYALQMSQGKTLALVKITVSPEDLYPEDDFLMTALGKPVYTQEELDAIRLEDYQSHWRKSLEFMGNVAVRPESCTVEGIRVFNGSRLLCRFDPVVAPLNYLIMGEYYRRLSDWIYAGKDLMEFERDGPHLLARVMPHAIGCNH